MHVFRWRMNCWRIFHFSDMGIIEYHISSHDNLVVCHIQTERPKNDDSSGRECVIFKCLQLFLPPCRPSARVSEDVGRVMSRASVRTT